MGKKTSLRASSKAVDPQLAALFASSSGPVSTPPTSRYQEQRESGRKSKSDAQDSDDDDDDDEVLSEASEELDYEDDEDDDEKEGHIPAKEDAEENVEEAAEEESSATETGEEVAEPRKERKRKRKEDNEDLEEKYLANLTKDDEEEPSVKRVKAGEEGSGSDNSDDEDADEKDDMPAHESLTKEAKVVEADKAARTVFLANVAAEAVSSKSSKRTLLAHLATALDKDAEPAQKVESIRFRSVAFSTGSMPKRAAYITKSVMESTTHSTNAYVVFSTAAAARRVCQQLNGTEVLGRHVRVDSVAHPSPTAHRRCVFVGNLGFVDDETVTHTTKEGKEETKKRNKVPSDIEEGLWRTFSKNGKVENVRVVRDPKTRVGKGFAYVQFYDANAVEEALLLDGKSFPPMLPRKLRVTRAKDPRKTTQAIERTKAKFNSKNAHGKEQSGKPSRKGAFTYVPKVTPDQKAAAGRAGKLFGRSGARGADRAGAGGPGNNNSSSLPGGIKAPERIVFEGRRASARDGLPKDLKFGKKGGKGKKGRPVNRSARRGADWKKKSDK